MTRRPAPRSATPGRHVQSGSLRVDAARAIRKLRDYQLPEPEMWVLELIRAAVLLGAEEIHVDGDADDVRVRWPRARPEIEDVTALFDELVNPSSSETRRHLRLLATAVNTALGLAPRYLDVYLCSAGAAQRVRFTPSVLDVDEDDPLAGATGLRTLAATEEARPLTAPDDGVLVHLRRRPSLGVLGTLVSGREAPELRLIRRSCEDSRVPLTIGGAVFTRERSTRDLLRVPLEDSEGSHLALLRTDALHSGTGYAVVDANEGGVLLESYPLALSLPALAPLPLRLSLDADRLPTNASRSAVRRDEAPLAGVADRAAVALGVLVEHLLRELGDEPSREWADAERRELLASTFALIASSVVGEDIRDQVPALLAGPLGSLGDLPLLRDAFGLGLTLRTLENAPRRGAFVYRGEEALGEELRPWLDDLVWVPAGDAAERLFARSELHSTDYRIRRARESLEASRGFMSRPPHLPEVPRQEGQWLAASLEELTSPGDSAGDGAGDREGAVAALFLAHLEGQLCLRPAAPVADVSYLHAGRLLAQHRIDSPLSFEAVVSSDLIAPADDYTGPLFDGGVGEVDRGLVIAAFRAVDEVARWLLGEPWQSSVEARVPWLRAKRQPTDDADAVRGYLRSAIRAHGRAFGPGGVQGPLRRAPVWPVANPLGDAQWASLDEVAAASEGAADTLFVAGPEAARRLSPGLPGGRLVVAAATNTQQVLAAYCAEDTQIVRYGPADLTDLRNAAVAAAELTPLTGAALAFRRESGFGAIGLRPGPPTIDVYHVGRRVVRQSPLSGSPGFGVHYESPLLIPNAAFQEIRGGSIPWRFAKEEGALLRALARRLLGEEVPELVVAGQTLREDLRAQLLEVLGERGLVKALGKRLAKRFRALPLLRVHGRSEEVSLDDLLALHPKGLGWVTPEESTEYDLGAFHPLRASAALAAAVAALLDKESASATEAFRLRRDIARRRHLLEAHRRKAPWGEGDLEIEPSAPRQVVVPEAPALPRVEVSLALGEGRGPFVMLVEDRVFDGHDLPPAPPGRVVVHLAQTAIDQSFEGLTTAARRSVEGLLVAGVAKLLATVVVEDPTVVASDPAVRGLLDWWLAQAPDQEAVKEALARAGQKKGRKKGHQKGQRTKGASSEPLPGALARAPLFATIQGDRAGALDALRRTKVYVASYVGMWLGPDDDEAPDNLDQAVLHVVEGPTRPRQLTLIRKLTGRDVSDVTLVAERLQARRRVARGLVPKPTVHSVPGVSQVHDTSVLVGKHRKLRGALGPGQIGLAAGAKSRALFYRDGVRTGSAEVDVRPPIVVALDTSIVGDCFEPRRQKAKGKNAKHQRGKGRRDGERAGRERREAALIRRIQELADRLVERLVHDGRIALLTADQKRPIATAALAGVVLANYRGWAELPLFETTSGEWHSKRDLDAQFERFGDVWTVPRLDCEDLALDADRLTFRIPAGAWEVLLEAGLGPVDATRELELDRVARTNRSRPPAPDPALALEERPLVLGVHPLVESPGDADDPVREGVVAPLLPGSGGSATLRLSRGRVPLGEHPDPCDWPTISVVDAPGIAPNRTWSGADVADLRFASLCDEVRAASERALASLVEAPSGVRWVRRIRAGQCKAAEVGVPVRGVLWAGDALGPPGVRVIDDAGVRALRAASGASRLPLHGTLYVHGPAESDAAERIAAAAYRYLLRGMARRLAAAWDPALAAHVIHGLGLGLVHTGDLGEGHAWPLGAPGPVGPETVGAWLSSWSVVWTITSAQLPEVEEAFASRSGGPSKELPWFVDDGSVAAGTLRGLLGDRARPWPPAISAASPAPPGDLPEARVPAVGTTRAAAGPAAETGGGGGKESDWPLPAALQQRLRDAGIAAQVALYSGRRRRLVRYDMGAGVAGSGSQSPMIELTASHPQVVAVMAALAAGDPRAGAAVDLLVARIAGAVRRIRELPFAGELAQLTALLETGIGAP